jgi:hypothetical protein
MDARGAIWYNGDAGWCLPSFTSRLRAGVLCAGPCFYFHLKRRHRLFVPSVANLKSASSLALDDDSAVQSAQLSQGRDADCEKGRYCWPDNEVSLNLGGFGRMQNRYVADIGDYVKFAILRRLAFGRRLGVAWWLFPDEHHNTDGAHREYLGQRNEWAHFDPDLFEALLKIENEKKLNVLTIEEAAVLPNAVFASDPVPCEARPYSLRLTERSNWLAGIRTKLTGCDLVFLDPDNGIAPEGLKLTAAQRRKECDDGGDQGSSREQPSDGDLSPSDPF